MAARRWLVALGFCACTPRGDAQPEARSVEPARTEQTPATKVEAEPAREHVPGAGISQIAAGVHHACARRDGRVSCWGLDRNGILGVGEDAPKIAMQRDSVGVPSLVIGLESVGEIVTVAVDYDFSCLLTGAGEVYCWGENDVGQLGTGDRISRAQPTKVNGLPAVVSLDVSFGKVCATTKGGEVSCWGSGAFGDEVQPKDGGHPPREFRLQPTEVAQLSGADQVDGDCLLRRGKVSCWGHNAGGQVGNGEGGCEYDGPLCPNSRCAPDKICKYVANPVAALGLAKVIELDVGGQLRYARTPDGVVWQWGQVGHTMSLEPRDTYRPQPREDLPSMVEVSAGGSHACARTEEGELWCWGNDSFGQLGFELTGHDSEQAPRRVEGLPKVRAIAAGFYFTGVLAGEGEPQIWCWGDNGNGQLGDGTIDRRATPAPVVW